MIKEQCVANIKEAMVAVEHGADRLELAPNIEVGGVTPSYGLLKYVLDNIEIPTMVMIRPRGGDFCYSDIEFEIMKNDLNMCKKMGVKGVVFGILTSDRRIDLDRNMRLCELAGNMEKVFHKAFDEVSYDRMEQELERLVDCGFDRLLTTAGLARADEAIDRLNQLIEWSRNRVKIMPAGKITHENIDFLSKHIFSNEFHGRKIIRVSK